MDPQPQDFIENFNENQQESKDLEKASPHSLKKSQIESSHYQRSLHKSVGNNLQRQLLVDETADIKLEDLIISEEDIAKLDKGCFVFYKVILLIIPPLMLGFSVWKNNVILMIQYVYLLAFCILEFFAIHQKDIRKAVLAIIGFKMYILLFTFVHIIVLFMENKGATYFLEWLLQLMGFYIIIFYGAAQVMNTLTKAIEGLDPDETGATDTLWLSTLCFFCYAMN